MERTDQGIILTERDEFIVIGQVHSGDRKSRAGDLSAAAESLRVLTPVPNSEPPQWMVSKANYKGYPNVFMGGLIIYEHLLEEQAEEHDISSDRAAERERIVHLKGVLEEFLEEVLLGLGVPPAD